MSNSQCLKKEDRGFTLIELLIVIAIIAILALIAIPNFLEAQTRSKVARVMADMRSMAVAVEAYYVDYNAPPFGYGRNPANTQISRGWIEDFIMLTTPVAYITSLNYRDPFWRPNTEYGGTAETAGFVNIQAMQEGWDSKEGKHPASYGHFAKWVVVSNGPNYCLDSWITPTDTDPYIGNYGNATCWQYQSRYTPWKYDPTNGTVSAGDIFRFQGN
ncbi:MAG: prepilin-type N-terminal cleavage/methylation domain-containing protein [Candidatus Sumerlaeota bacterium]|nr:prepilin-type N-terminal cleavage/methylation domain-containing protein [Candidatus Sumerlaeota bacterium]